MFQTEIDLVVHKSDNVRQIGHTSKQNVIECVEFFKFDAHSLFIRRYVHEQTYRYLLFFQSVEKPVITCTNEV